jgi:prefoldin alpha subunit
LSQISRERLAQEYGYLAQIAEELEKEITLAQSLVAEVEAAISALKNINSLEDSKEILVPVSSGIYIRANVKKQEKFLVAIARDILVEKTFEETLDFLSKRKEELNQLIQKRVDDLNKIVSRIREIEGIIKATK